MRCFYCNVKLNFGKKIIRQKRINLEEPISYVDASEIRKITGEEPRLMAYIDQEEELPRIFRTFGVFILPVTRRKYVIVKGKGYHKVEPISTPIIEHVAMLPLSVFQAKENTETQCLDYAYNTGLIEKFLETKRLFLGPRGKMVTPMFEFYVGTSLIRVKGSQIEIDGSYIGDTTVAIVEAKIGIPKTFAIKQLYYPYRTLCIKYVNNNVRPVFFAFDRQEGTYNFWEYGFPKENSFESIELIKQARFKIRAEPLKPEDFIKTESDLTPLIPQADDFQKVLEFPVKVGQGITDSKAMAEEFNFTPRQSSYYRQASEMLGLVTMRNNRYELTDEGRKFIQLSTPERQKMACELLLKHPIMREILQHLIDHPNESVSYDEVTNIIKQKSRLRSTTLLRRTQTIFKWFKWIQQATGIVNVRGKEIWLAGMHPYVTKS